MTQEYQDKAAVRQERYHPFDTFYNEQLTAQNQPNIDAFNEAFNKNQEMAGPLNQTITQLEADAQEQEEPSTTGDILKQVASGPIRAANEFMQATDELADYMVDTVGFSDLGELQILNEQGEFDLDFVSRETARQRGLGPVELPTFGEAETVPGALAGGISQFVAGFIPAAKAMKLGKAATTGSAIRRGVGAAAITDFTFFDPHEERLSNLLREHAELRDPVTKFLAADPLDTSLEGRFKNVLEGLGLEAATAGIFTAGLKAYRGIKNIRAEESDVAAEAFGINVIEPEAEDVFKTQGKELVFDGDIDKESLFDVEVKVKDKAFNVNLARIESSDDIKKIIARSGDILDPDVATKTDVDVTTATRGRQSNKRTEELANELGMTVQDLLSRRQGQAFNAEEAVAARNLLVSSAENLEKLARKVDSLEATDVDRAALQKAMNIHIAIQKEVSGLTAEAGRALQAFNIQARTQKEQINAINEFMNMSGGRGQVDARAKTLLKVMERHKGRPGKINKEIDKLSRATTLDMILEVWINAILSGPITHAKNIIGNSLVVLNRIPEKAIMAGIGRVTGSADRVQFGEVGAEIHGLMMGLRDGWVMAKESFKTKGGTDPLSKVEVRRREAITAENIRQSMIGKVLPPQVLEEGGVGARFVDGLATHVIRAPGTFLSAEDAFFKGVNYRMSLHAHAYREATAEGLNGDAMAARMAEIIDNPPERIRVEAMEKAHINTFTDPNKAAMGLRKFTDQVPASRFVVPFLNTPSNLIKFTFERTPLIAGLGRTYKDAIAAGGARRDEALAKVTNGAMLYAYAGYLASQGLITGSQPSNFAKRNIQNKVLPPNSLIFGGKAYSYRPVDPFGMMIGLAADFVNIARDAEPWEVAEMAASMTMATTNNILSKTWMTGISDFMDVMTGAATSEGEPSQHFKNWSGNLTASFMPNFIRQTNVNFVDPYMREATELSNRILSKLPGFSEDLPLRRDIWGEPRLYNLVETPSSDPVNKLLAGAGLGISMPRRIFTFNGHSTRLTDEEYSEFVRMSRVPAKKELDKYYDNLDRLFEETQSADELDKAVKKIISKHTKHAKNKLLQDFPEIVDRIQIENDVVF